MELKNFIQVIRKKMWLLSIFVLVGIVGALIKSYILTTPLYQAEAQLIVNDASLIENTGNVNSNSIDASIMLINSYSEIIKSAAIMNKVVAAYPDLGYTPKELSASVSVTSANQSQVMNLTLIGTSNKNVTNAVNAIAHVFIAEIPMIMNVDNVTILSEAVDEDSKYPINMSPVLDLMVSVVVTLFLGIGFVVLLHYLDNTVKTEDDVFEVLAVPTLVSIAEFSKKNLKKRGRVQRMEGESLNV
ncbi:YveK family protein [Paenibacillus soyae]|uniref:Wzz/FepE/Etk N-terminal domain-containing protein n=1 Tax=Paenibacillus soyae TaxID=2969249 RepID=A0A9X2SDS2_9BACL|nr:Wzz/FepE/Etk N-terminal domain-containing protein [Paenibacillus soyae]